MAGSAVIQLVCCGGKGVDVRALVRSRDHRSEGLEKVGIETVVGDFMNLQSLREAMSGVDRALFCYPINAGLLEAALNMAIAARDASPLLGTFRT